MTKVKYADQAITSSVHIKIKSMIAAFINPAHSPGGTNDVNQTARMTKITVTTTVTIAGISI
jgi:hypothetical protein